MSEPRKVTYDPTIFDVGSMQQARWIAVSPDGVHTSEERWEIETEYLMEIVDAYLPPRDATALDFGCGPGRLAKPLIERKNWSVLGVDRLSLAPRQCRLTLSGIGLGNAAYPARCAFAPQVRMQAPLKPGFFSFMCRGADLVRLHAARDLVEKLL